MLKNVFLIILITTSSFSVFAQEFKKTINIKPAEPYTIKVVKTSGEYAIEITQVANSQDRTYTTSSFTSEVLNSLLILAYEEITVTTLTGIEKGNIKNLGRIAFMESVAALTIEDGKGPKTASIKLTDEAKVYDKEIATKPLKKFKPSHCQIIFEDGFIRTVIVTGKIGTDEAIFSSLIAYGVTTRTNITFLYNRHLLREDIGSDSKESVKFGEIIDYQRVANLKTTDHSPRNQSLLLFPDQTISLYKESNSKLFEMRFFSDFAGVVEENPNGLIQTEVGRRLNLWTKRRGKRSQGYGFFTYFDPVFTLSKIEQNNRNMTLNYYENDSCSIFYIQPLQSYRFQIANLYNQLNIISIQGSVIDFEVNSLFGWSLARVKDTITIDSLSININESLNSVYAGVGLQLAFHPESRWSFTASSKLLFMNGLSDDLEFRSPTKDGVVENREWLSRTEMLASWKQPKSDNSIFARFRLTAELANFNSNYSQFQLGYSVFFKSN